MNQFQIYGKLQDSNGQDHPSSRQDQRRLSSGWKDSRIPRLQRLVVDAELGQMRRGRPPAIYRAFAQALNSLPIDGFTLLDVGCASGYYSEVIERLVSKKAAYEGVDYSKAMIAEAQSHYPDRSFQVGDILCLPYERKFDVVVASGVLEHISDYELALKELSRLAKKFLVLHRVPISSKDDDFFTIGSQYRVKVSRTYFSRTFAAKVEVYGWKLRTQNATYGSGRVYTMVFERQE